MSNKEHVRVKISQAILLVYNKKILILRHKSGKWLLPGGRLNVLETWIDGLFREIKEETGISGVEIVSILEVDNWITGDQPHYGVFFHGKSPTDTVVLSDEHIDYAWVSKDGIQNYEFWSDGLQERISRLIEKVL